MKTLRCNDNASIPILGLGTYKLIGETARKAVKTALDVGYRHIDTASRYGNQREIGAVVAASDVPREEIFITSKIWHTNLRPADLRAEFDQTLNELQTDYLDLLLIHWPNSDIPVSETLEAMYVLKREGRVRAVGVSNFTISHLHEVVDAGFHPAVNQVEYHPSLHQEDLRSFCQDNDIVVTAYSPLAQGHDLDLPVIKSLAKKYNRSAAQVILNWLMSKGIVVIPRSSNPDYIRDNFNAIEWTLDPSDIARIDEIDAHNRIINPPYAEFL